MDILGIETSCDETSAAVVRDGRTILSNVIASQIDLHVLTGGVVPEVAARSHVERINAVISTALDQAGIHFAGVGGIAVANRPGLLGALLVGVSAAKALAYALHKPLIAVHHIEAHIYANWLVAGEIEFPALCLVVSGGHTELFLLRGHGDYTILGRTRDDAAGEAFDKSARLLGLPYPGGITIDRLAREGGNPSAVPLPRAWLGMSAEASRDPDEIDSLDFSFSGLKTAVSQAVRNKAYSDLPQRDWAASIQEAIVDVLVGKALRAAARHRVPRVLMAGGVAANSRLKERMRDACRAAGLPFTCPPAELCTDNAAMIACAGYYHWQAGKIDSLDIDTLSTERLA
ncbi:MAG: tRNA (adenosine(37)-N6)-threonylcarbamoyltransferase complex transferase subunit TsaD [Capsulimonadaceae bacterium]